MRNIIPSIPGLFVLWGFIIAVVIYVRAVKDWKQRCLRIARNNYIRSERTEDKYDEREYRDQLEEERLNRKDYNFWDDPKHIIQ